LAGQLPKSAKAKRGLFMPRAQQYLGFTEDRWLRAYIQNLQYATSQHVQMPAAWSEWVGEISQMWLAKRTRAFSENCEKKLAGLSR